MSPEPLCLFSGIWYDDFPEEWDAALVQDWITEDAPSLDPFTARQTLAEFRADKQRTAEDMPWRVSWKVWLIQDGRALWPVGKEQRAEDE